MEFSLERLLEILRNTPAILTALFRDLNYDWTMSNEGANSWTPKEVVAHLIICEQINWLPRIRLILLDGAERSLAPIDMSAHFEIAGNTGLPDLLHLFGQLRTRSIGELESFHLQEADFFRTANHPVIGEVNLSQLVATWATHDLAHTAQIARTMARQSKDLVGPFKHFIPSLHK